MTNDELKDRIFYVDYREAWVREDELLKMTDDEKHVAEEFLMQMLDDRRLGFFSLEALTFLETPKVLPILYARMGEDNVRDFLKSVMASFIYRINGDEEMLASAINKLSSLKKPDIVSALGYLYRINRIEVKNAIAEFVDDPEHSIRYNAKRYLDLMGNF